MNHVFRPIVFDKASLLFRKVNFYDDNDQSRLLLLTSQSAAVLPKTKLAGRLVSQGTNIRVRRYEYSYINVRTFYVQQINLLEV